MTERERHLFENECDSHPWMREVKMTDDEFREQFDRDFYDGYTDRWGNHLYNDHWSWVCLCVLKYFYETGKYMHIDYGYLDGQNENDIMKIMKKHGVDDETFWGVLDNGLAFKF